MRPQALFLVLIATQAAHSVEEYYFRLYAEFRPAQVVSGLFSSDLRMGFIAANTLLVGFGLACYLVPVRRRWTAATGVMWFWTVLEGLNGFGHLLRSVIQRGYTAGAATAVPLLALSILLIRRLFSERGGPPDYRT